MGGKLSATTLIISQRSPKRKNEKLKLIDIN